MYILCNDSQVIGTSRSPCWKDKSSLPYMEAMILETQRLANIGFKTYFLHNIKWILY